MADTETKKPTVSSNEYTRSYNPYRAALKSSRDTSTANTTQLIPPPGDHTAHLTSYSGKSPSLRPYARSLSACSPPSLQLNVPQSDEAKSSPKLHRSLTMMNHRPSQHPPPPSLTSPTTIPASSSPTPTSQPRFNAPIEAPSEDSLPIAPLPYRPDLHPKASPLRPHCIAKDHLRLWIPVPPSVDSRSSAITIISEDQLDRVLRVMDQSWHDSTKAVYGAGLLVFHVFCDNNNIPDTARCPATADLILAFIASCAGSYAGSTVSNYVAGLKAWHTLHGQPWTVNPDALKRCIEGAVKLTPLSAKRPQRAPFTPEIISLFRLHLRLNEPLDAAIFACMTTCFWCIARLGEFTVQSTKTFRPSKHITRAGFSEVRDRNNFLVKRFDLPWTKMTAMSGKGESVQCAKQDGPADPFFALENHLVINPGQSSDHLFAWKHVDGSLHPLSKRQFTSRISALTKLYNLPNIKGHSLRIGGTLEYLLRGVPFDVVQSQGRWAGQAFTLYLRKHAMILAPYLQASPALEPFVRHTQPPIR